MELSIKAPQGMVVTPHHLASQSALGILREGGTAIEAVIAAAAVLSVVYPQMNSIGGDSFWLIMPPNGEPIAIDASGPAGSLATLDFYAGETTIPKQGPKAALTVAGTVGGWQEALNYVTECGYKRVSIKRLLSDAITYAEDGFPITENCLETLRDLKDRGMITKDIERVFLQNGKIPKEGQILRQPRLAETFKCLRENGLNSFYRGELAKAIAADILHLGMPITETDLENFKAVRVSPLQIMHSKGVIYNLPPPTQGLLSLSILGILDTLNISGKDEADFIHTTIEATKQGFLIRDQYITDPKFMAIDPESLITPAAISKMANNITDKASAYGKGNGPGDTVWIGVMDKKGFSVSFIQSIYHKFGSGVVLPTTGITWQNRGVAFSLNKNSILALEPGKKPFTTLSPAAAKLNDGRVMVYGSEGGDGQPQFQGAVFHRYVIQDLPLQKSISLPRWLFGRKLDDVSDNLRIESRFSNETINDLVKRGHVLQMMPEFSSLVGQAGALVKHTDGVLEGAYDPRSDGSAVGF